MLSLAAVRVLGGTLCGVVRLALIAELLLALGRVVGAALLLPLVLADLLRRS